MFHVNESRRAAVALCLRHDVLANGGLAGRFGSEDFRDPTAWDAANAEGNIQRKRTG